MSRFGVNLRLVIIETSKKQRFNVGLFHILSVRCRKALCFWQKNDGSFRHDNAAAKHDVERDEMKMHSLICYGSGYVAHRYRADASFRVIIIIILNWDLIIRVFYNFAFNEISKVQFLPLAKKQCSKPFCWSFWVEYSAYVRSDHPWGNCPFANNIKRRKGTTEEQRGCNIHFRPLFRILSMLELLKKCFSKKKSRGPALRMTNTKIKHSI